MPKNYQIASKVQKLLGLVQTVVHLLNNYNPILEEDYN